MKPTGSVRLKRGKEKPVRNRHPWIFSGAIQTVQGAPADGDVIDVVDAQGQFLARGYYNRRSQITVRLLSWQDEEIDAAFLRSRIAASIERRRSLGLDGSAYRLVHAESDLLPGLIVDLYADYVVVQILTLGMERWKDDIASALSELVPCSGVYDRSDVDVRRLEGLPRSTGVLWGQEPPDRVEIVENGLKFLVSIKTGQKTGFYLDQRENRSRVSAYSSGREVLNAFAYTGAQAVYALSGGAARVVNVDTSAKALAEAKANLVLNSMDPSRAENVIGDVFQVLRRYRAAGQVFDLVVLDPPKFASSRSQVQRACRGYKDINLLAMQLLRPKGILATFSCSGLVSPDLFQKVVFGASVDAGRDVQIVEKRSQASDHPILLSFPEGEYLKGLICQAL